MFLKRCLVLGWLLLLTQGVLATEVYTLVTPDCRFHSGLLLNADEKQVTMLTLDGKSRLVQRSEVYFVFVHNTLNNPIPRIGLDERTLPHLSEVYIENRDEPELTGWPVRFIEDLVVFYDLKGKTHILALNQISKIRTAQKKPSVIRKIPYTPFQLKLENSGLNCSKKVRKSSKKLIVPTRIFANQIQVSELLNTFSKGFERFASYKERTFLYPRHIMYDTETRLGLTLFGNRQENTYSTPMPLYFQWGNAEPFGLQNYTQIGEVPINYLPNVEPLSVINSEIKSHMFHFAFSANLFSIPAGTEFYSDGAFGEVEGIEKQFDEGIFSATSFNYAALFGVDYLRWSFSIGNYYPIYFIQAKNNLREALAFEPSILVRLAYTQKLWRLRFSTSLTDRTTSDVTDKQLSIDTRSSVLGVVSTHSMSSDFFRVGGDYEFTSIGVKASADFSWIRGNYAERLVDTTENAFEFEHAALALKLSKRFGDYVNFAGYGILFDQKRTSAFSGETITDNNQEFSGGALFEFIF